MSYWVYIVDPKTQEGPCPTCGHDPIDAEPWFEVGNMTSNVARMWYRAMPWREGMLVDTYKGKPDKLGGIAGLHGMLCKDALPIVQEGLEYMKANKESLKELEPENGWGNYDGALRYLQTLRHGCADYPGGMVDVSR